MNTLSFPIIRGATELALVSDGNATITHAGDPRGAVSFEVTGDRLIILSLVIDDGSRGHGTGSAAARALVHAAANAGFERVRALAPPDKGLAVYFWFRMGLRPVHGPGPGGGIWLERDLRPRSGVSASREA